MKYRNRYLLIRHGHSQANEAGKIVSSPSAGIDGYGLSTLGTQQLDRLVSDWSWPQPTLLLHSDFLRTFETAARIGKHFGLPLQSDQRLRERFFGELDGMPDHLYHNVWELDAADAHHTQFGVESVASVARRMREVIESLEATHRDERIVLVSHGDPLQIVLTALEEHPLTRHRERPALAPASVTSLGDSSIADDDL